MNFSIPTTSPPACSLRGCRFVLQICVFQTGRDGSRIPGSPRHFSVAECQRGAIQADWRCW